jgi:hypothetical protein
MVSPFFRLLTDLISATQLSAITFSMSSSLFLLFILLKGSSEERCEFVRMMGKFLEIMLGVGASLSMRGMDFGITGLLLFEMVAGLAIAWT